MSLSRAKSFFLILVAFLAAGGVIASNTSGTTPALEGVIRPLSMGSALSAPIAALPVRLRIPKIKVDAAIRGVGITKNKDMAVLDSYADVGWYKFGPRPGLSGSAVLNGHLDTGTSPIAVFAKLKELSPGDQLTVEDKEGRIFHFRVVKTKIYGYKDPAPEVFQSSGQVAHLNLITCTGNWISSKKSYDKRLVVFTELFSIS